MVLQLMGEKRNTVPIIIAAATALDPSDAILKGLEELALMERFIHGRMRKQRIKDFDRASVHSLYDHVDYWLCNQDRYPKMKHNSHVSIQLSDLPKIDQPDRFSSYSEILTRLHQTGFQTYIADITPPDINSLGMKVVRSIITGYIPLNKNYNARPIHLDRLQHQFPLNIEPHPFA